VEVLPTELVKLLQDREVARQTRDFVRADEIRDEITARGYLIEDGSDGAKLRRK